MPNRFIDPGSTPCYKSPVHSIVANRTLISMSGIEFPAWARSSHPIVWRETRRWRRSRVWRIVASGGGWLALLFGGLAWACGTLALLPLLIDSDAPAGAIVLALGGAFTLGAALASMFLSWLLGLVTSALAAMLIAREREEQTWAYLRVTLLTTTEIVGGKIASLAYTLAAPLRWLILLRLCAMAATIGTLGLAFVVVGGFPPEVMDTLRLVLPSPMALAVTASGLGLGALIAAVYWLAEPFLETAYNGAVGLAASAMSRTRGWAIGLTFILHFGLGLMVYAPAQQIISLAFLTVAPTANEWALARLTPVFFGLAPFALNLALRLAVAATCIIFVWRRLERLEE